SPEKHTRRPRTVSTDRAQPGNRTSGPASSVEGGGPVEHPDPWWGRRRRAILPPAAGDGVADHGLPRRVRRDGPAGAQCDEQSPVPAVRGDRVVPARGGGPRRVVAPAHLRVPALRAAAPAA